MGDHDLIRCLGEVFVVRGLRKLTPLNRCCDRWDTCARYVTQREALATTDPVVRAMCGTTDAGERIDQHVEKERS